MKRTCLAFWLALVSIPMVYGSGYKAPDYGKKASWLRYVPTAAFRTPGSVGKTVSSVWFTSDGVATHASPQGQMLTWAANCLANDTLQWEIWLDNGNGLFDSLGANQDLQLFVYSVANGDTLGGRGLPDTTAVLDNEIVNALKNGFAPALYWLKAVSLVDGSSAFDSVRVTPMVSPWATISGHVHVPGDSALQENLWVEADIYTGGDGGSPIFWATLTDSYGNYTINMDNTYLDTLWDIGGLSDLAGGYIAPADTTIRVNGGSYTGANFAYAVATDSVTGEVRDELGAPLSITAYVYAQQDSREKYAQTSGSHYQLFFSIADTGTWRLGCGWDGSAPYMNPSQFDIQPAGAGHIIHDFKAYRATDSIKGTVTEQGGVSSRVYRIYAWSDFLQISSSTLTDPSTGAYKLMVSDSTDYNVGIDTWSEEYPIPDGWTVNPSGYNNVNPPATGKNFDLSPATEFIEGQITQDPGDTQPIDYDQIWLQAWPTSGGSGFQTQPNISGQYSIPAMPDTYDVGAGYNNNGRFLFQPSRYQSLIVHPNDTLRNKDFLANYGHCQVEVALTGYPSATQNWMGASDDNAWPNGYQTNVEVDNSGTYNLYICNSTGWNVWAPGIAGYDVSPGSYYLGDIFHSDTYRGVLTFTYTPTGVEGNPQDRPMPMVFKLSQNHPNPVRNVVSISYQLPKPAKVSMTIYNILGQAVKSFDEGSKEAGYYNIKWDGRDDRNSLLGNGIYFYRLQAGEFVATKKMVLMR